MVIGVGGGGIAYALNILPKVVIPIWVWIGLALLGVFIAQFLAYRGIRSSLLKQVITPNQIEGVLTRLAELREEGNTLQLIGWGLKDIKEIPGFERKFSYWRKLVEDETAKLSPSAAVIFRTGGVVDIKLFKKKALDDKHAVILQSITQDMEKIEKTVEQLSPQNLAERLSIGK